MENFETTDAVEGDALPSAEAFDQEEALEESIATGDESVDDQDATDEDQLEEIERNGRTATIPAWLKPELMMQADYTRKTQELAEARRTFEAEREEVQQLSQAELSARANLDGIERQIGHYTKVDWNAWHASDPAAAQQEFARFQLFQNARSETLSYLDGLGQERTARAERETAARVQQAHAELARDLEGWSPETATRLLDFGRRHYGFSSEELDRIDDARVIKALDASYRWEEHQARQRQAQRHVAAQAVRPAAKVGGAAPKSGLDDRLSAEEWLRRRNSQVRRKA